MLDSDRPVSQNIKITMKKTHKIIDAAIRVFARDGLEKGKIADIAKEAGIGKGTVYEYFRSKEDIFKAIENIVFAEFDTVFDSLLIEEKSPAEKLVSIMDHGLNAHFEMGDAMLIIVELWAQAGRGHVHGKTSSDFIQYYDRSRDQIQNILQAGINSGDFREMNKEGVATLLLAVMDGLAWQFVTLKDPEKIQKVKTEAVNSFMRGILI